MCCDVTPFVNSYPRGYNYNQPGPERFASIVVRTADIESHTLADYTGVTRVTGRCEFESRVEMRFSSDRSTLHCMLSATV